MKALKDSLPYVIWPSKKKLKLLIDTGSTRSFLKPEIVKAEIPQHVKTEKINVITPTGRTEVDEYILSSTPAVFHKHSVLKFHLFNFDPDFDGLLGNDTLTKLDAEINLKNQTLKLHNVTLPIHKKSTDNKKCYRITIEPRTEKICKIPVDIDKGLISIPESTFAEGKVELRAGINYAKNYETICSLINHSDEEITVKLNETYAYQDDIEINGIPKCKSFAELTTLRTSHMTLEERLKIEKFIKKFLDVCQTDEDFLTATCQTKHTIHTTDEVPVHGKMYRYPQCHKEEVQKQFSRMLEQNIIRKSYSPWCSPVLVVPKKMDASGKQKWRIAIDYRALNDKTIYDRYPLPNISDVLERLGSAKYFSVIDLKQGFHQIPMDEGSIQKTAFRIESGLYEFLRMPYGLRNAPPTFQRMMDEVLSGYLNQFCLVYIDDIIIFSSSLDEHIQHLTKVFERLRQYNLKTQMDKCEFIKKELLYLGHLVTTEGLKPNPEKIKAVQDFKIPETQKQLKGFLGLLSYYRRFIPNFATICKPLTKRLKKGAKIIPTDEDYIECIEKCKTLLCNEPILQFPDYSKEFIVTTDASDVGIGAVLSQGPIGQDKPICYASRTLNDSEQNYSATEKECLAMVWACKQFRPHIFGRKFKLYTDHMPLKWLFNLKEPNSKLMRWRVKLSEYDFEIEYKKGKQNTNADALSRLPTINCNNIFDDMNLDDMDPTGEIHSLINLSLQVHDDQTNDPPDELPELNAETISQILHPTENSPENNSIEQNVDPEPSNADFNEHHSENNDTIHSVEDNTKAEIPIKEDPINFCSNQIIIKSQRRNKNAQFSRLFTETKSPKIRVTVYLPKINREAFVINLIKEYVQPRVKYGLYFEDENDYPTIQKIISENFDTTISLTRYKIFLTDIEDEITQLELIKTEHDLSHRGIQENTLKLKEKYYWPNLQKSVQKLINNCETCNLNKYDRNPIKVPLKLTETPEKPFQKLHMDITHYDGHMILTMIDDFSKYGQAYLLNDKTSLLITDKLLYFFRHCGTPEKIVMDDGSEFKAMVEQLLHGYGIRTHITCYQHSHSNGVIEKFNNTLKDLLRIMDHKFSTLPKRDLNIKLNYAIFAYNNTIHTTTKMTPFNVLFKTEQIKGNPKDKFTLSENVQQHMQRQEQIFKNIAEIIRKRKTTYINQFNRKRKDDNISIPDKVFVVSPYRKNAGKRFEKRKVIKREQDKFFTKNQKRVTKMHPEQIKRPTKYFVTDQGSPASTSSAETSP